MPVSEYTTAKFQIFSMPNNETDPTRASDTMALYFFKAIAPTGKYPSFMPMYQINGEAFDFLLPADVGDALAASIDLMVAPILYASDKLANYNGYRDSLLTPPKFASRGTYRCDFRTSVPNDNANVKTVLDYRTLSELAVTILMDSASAGELDDVLAGWVLTHSMALNYCGGFTLLRVGVTETLPTNYDTNRTPNRNDLRISAAPNRRHSFKQYLSLR